MTKSQEYNLFYSTYNMLSGKIKPTIGTPTINGSSVNCEIASFLEPNGVRYTQDLINEISHLANSTQPISEFMVSSPCGEDYLEFSSAPGRVVFNTGGQDVVVPVNDFLQILNEWKAFVQSVPTPHWLENR